jgi:hypothetical protein
MRSDSISELQAVCDSATQWRNSLTGGDVTMITVMVGGGIVTLAWNSDNNNWDIRTQ